MAIDVIRSKIVIADLSYIKPVFRASYIQIKVIAEVTMPDVLNVDIITPVDLISLRPEKAFFDSTTGFTDSETVEALKGISESLTMVDSADITYVIGKALADLQPIVESLAKTSTKPLPNDDLYLIDNMDGDIEFQFVKVVNELQFIAEQASLAIEKPASDVLSFADAISVLLIIVRDFSENLSITQTDFTLVLSKLLQENPLISDTLAVDNDKVLVDNGLTLDLAAKQFSKLILGYGEDYAEIGYFLEDYTADTIVGDRAFTNDEVNTLVIYGRSLADSAGVVEGGGVYMNTYCEASYFLEDYAGESRTFT
jgi:hypothetical protein